MITLTAKINLFDADKNASIYAVSSGEKEINISSRFENLVGTVKKTKKPFLLGHSKLGDGSTFQSKLDYFVGSISADSNGEFASPQTFYITTNYDLSSLTVSFDNANGGHPVHVVFDNVSHYVNSTEYTFGNLPSLGQHTMQILDWNKPNGQVVISGFYTNITVEINRRNLLSMNIDLPSKSDNSMPSFGIISSEGSVSFNDIDGKVENYAEQGLLVGGLSFEARINNTLKNGATQTVGVFQTSEWNYDAFKRSVSVTLTDGLEEWQDVHVDGISYNPNDISAWNGEDVYNYLQGITPSKYNVIPFAELDNDTKFILQNTAIPFKFLSAGSLWSQWQKLCTVCMSYVYKTADGHTTFSYKKGA